MSMAIADLAIPFPSLEDEDKAHVLDAAAEFHPHLQGFTSHGSELRAFNDRGQLVAVHADHVRRLMVEALKKSRFDEAASDETAVPSEDAETLDEAPVADETTEVPATDESLTPADPA